MILVVVEEKSKIHYFVGIKCFEMKFSSCTFLLIKQLKANLICKGIYRYIYNIYPFWFMNEPTGAPPSPPIWTPHTCAHLGPCPQERLSGCSPREVLSLSGLLPKPALGTFHLPCPLQVISSFLKESFSLSQQEVDGVFIANAQRPSCFLDRP